VGQLLKSIHGTRGVEVQQLQKRSRYKESKTIEVKSLEPEMKEEKGVGRRPREDQLDSEEKYGFGSAKFGSTWCKLKKS